MLLPLVLLLPALAACTPLVELLSTPLLLPAQEPLPTQVQPAEIGALLPYAPTDDAAATDQPAALVPPPTPPIIVNTPTLAPTFTPTPEPTAIPTETPTPTATPPPTETPTPVASPTPDPARQVNGIPFEALAPLDELTRSNVMAIAAAGQALGRNPRAFSKLGDSAVLTDHNLTRFDKPGTFNLGPYAALQPTIDHFAGSFARYGVGSRVGLTAIGSFDPMWANKNWCGPSETVLLCEIRLHNPAFLLIRLGTNDGNSTVFEQNMREIIRITIENGVVPIMLTKADRWEGSDNNNQAMRRLAAEFRVPLAEVDLLASTIPGRGLGSDNAHLSTYQANDYTDPQTFTRGYPMSDLATLITLDALRAVVEGR